MGSFTLNFPFIMKYAAVTLLVAGIALIAGQQYSVDLSNMRLLQDEPTEADTMENEPVDMESLFTDDPLCNDSVTDEATGTYTNGSSMAICTAESGYEACPCYGKVSTEAQEGMMQALGALAILWVCLLICVPLTLCIAIGCIVYHCCIKEK